MVDSTNMRIFGVLCKFPILKLLLKICMLMILRTSELHKT